MPSYPGKLRRFLRNPVGMTRRILRRIAGAGAGPYVPERYWEDRHREMGFDIRGVGHIGLGVEDNERLTRAGTATMKRVWQELGLRLPEVAFLDIGCGQGHFTQLFRHEGGLRYTGVDITDVLFARLRSRFPGFEFHKLDVSAVPLPGMFDVILMANVAEHIVQPGRLAYAMANVRDHLRPGGVFLVTVATGPRPATEAPHWRYWPLVEITPHFPGFQVSEARPFMNKGLAVLHQGP